MLAEPEPAVAVNEVGAPGAAAEKVTVQLLFGSLLFQLLSEVPCALIARI
jgi:hypothetical protein